MKRLTRLAAAALLCAPPAFAAVPLGEHFTFSGFGTLGAVQTNYADAQYVRELQTSGARKKPNAVVDSNLGLQLDGQFNSWLSGAVQSLSLHRVNDSGMSTRLEWAFLKAEPAKGVAIRAGKMALPTFLISDSRRIGFANTWLRPPNEVYGLDVLNKNLTGTDLSYRLPLFSHSLTTTALYGSSGIQQADSLLLKNKSVRGLNLVWDGDWYMVRLGYVDSKPQFDPMLGAALGLDLSKATYKFSGIGFMVDKANIVLQGEKVRRVMPPANFLVGGEAWYLMGGYRMGKVLPYVSVAALNPVKDGFVPPQRTKSAGLRWDAWSSAALKFQVERVDAKGTVGASFVPDIVMTPDGPAYGPLNKPVTTIGVAIDFIF